MKRRPRIVSLLPSATEIVCVLGFRDRLFGRSHECDFPPDVVSLPVCTAPRFEAEGTSRKIDDRVKALAHKALSLYEVKEDVLARLRPEVIVTQTQCEVCAVAFDDVRAAAERLVDREVELVSLEATTLDGIWNDIRRVAVPLGTESEAAVAIGGLQARMTSIGERAALADRRPTVLCLEWLDPVMTAGNWVPELVESAGGTPLLARAGEHSPWVEWDDVVAADPDVIVAMPCGFDIDRTFAEIALLTERPGWEDLRAVGEGRAYVVEANQFFNRPGPRIVESLEILAEIVHGGAFTFGHEGAGWRRIAA